MSQTNVPIEEFKEIIFSLLKEIDSFCTKKGISYFLIAGSLIGAVRHKDFIPWDDDIDICMLRSDYERFIKEYVPSNKYIKLLSLETDKKYIYPFAKIVDSRLVLIEDVPGAVEIGPYVDIFPLDNCPGDDFKTACKSIDKMTTVRWMRNFKIIRFDQKRSMLKNIILFFGKVFTLFFSRRALAKMISKKAKKHDDVETKFVGEIMNTAYGYGEVFPREWFQETIRLEFHGHYFCAPIHYKRVLESMYGDYMKLPPLEKRVSHHNFKCWYREPND